MKKYPRNPAIHVQTVIRSLLASTCSWLISDLPVGNFDECFAYTHICRADVHFFDLCTLAVLDLHQLVHLHIDLADKCLVLHLRVAACPKQDENAALLDEVEGVASRAQSR